MKKKTYDIVKEILEKHADSRNSDKVLLWYFWEYTNTLKYVTPQLRVLTKQSFLSSPSAETITRCRRKIQETHKHLSAVKSVEEARKLKEETKSIFMYRE